MSESTAVEVAPGVVFQEVEGEMVLLELETGRYFTLDDVGARCWALIAELGEVDAVVASMLAEFDVDEATLRADVRTLVGRLRAAGLLVSPAPAE
jgi:hypothetical protein